MASALAHRIDSDDVMIRPAGPGPSTASDPADREVPAWHATTIRALQQISLLESDWNARGAAAPDETAILLALEILEETALDLTPAPDVVPTATGGVQLEWHRSGMDIELDVAPDLRVCLYWRDRDSGREWEAPLAAWQPRELAEVLQELTARFVQRQHGAR